METRIPKRASLAYTMNSLPSVSNTNKSRMNLVRQGYNSVCEPNAKSEATLGGTTNNGKTRHLLNGAILGQFQYKHKTIDLPMFKLKLKAYNTKAERKTIEQARETIKELLEEGKQNQPPASSDTEAPVEPAPPGEIPCESGRESPSSSEPQPSYGGSTPSSMESLSSEGSPSSESLSSSEELPSSRGSPSSEGTISSRGTPSSTPSTGKSDSSTPSELIVITPRLVHVPAIVTIKTNSCKEREHRKHKAPAKRERKPAKKANMPSSKNKERTRKILIVTGLQNNLRKDVRSPVVPLNSPRVHLDGFDDHIISEIRLANCGMCGSSTTTSKQCEPFKDPANRGGDKTCQESGNVPKESAGNASQILQKNPNVQDPRFDPRPFNCKAIWPSHSDIKQMQLATRLARRRSDFVKLSTKGTQIQKPKGKSDPQTKKVTPEQTNETKTPDVKKQKTQKPIVVPCHVNMDCALCNRHFAHTTRVPKLESKRPYIVPERPLSVCPEHCLQESGSESSDMESCSSESENSIEESSDSAETLLEVKSDDDCNENVASDA